MNSAAFNILRVGVGITFLWIGVLIVRSPDDWSALLLPWAMHILPGSLTAEMYAVAAFDIVIGFLLIVGLWTWIAALLAALHLIAVLLITGISAVTCRDIGLLAAAIAILIESGHRRGSVSQ